MKVLREKEIKRMRKLDGKVMRRRKLYDVCVPKGDVGVCVGVESAVASPEGASSDQIDARIHRVRVICELPLTRTRTATHSLTCYQRERVCSMPVNRDIESRAQQVCRA